MRLLLIVALLLSSCAAARPELPRSAGANPPIETITVSAKEFNPAWPTNRTYGLPPHAQPLLFAPSGETYAGAAFALYTFEIQTNNEAQWLSHADLLISWWEQSVNRQFYLGLWNLEARRWDWRVVDWDGDGLNPAKLALAPGDEQADLLQYFPPETQDPRLLTIAIALTDQQQYGYLGTANLVLYGPE